VLSPPPAPMIKHDPLAGQMGDLEPQLQLRQPLRRDDSHHVCQVELPMPAGRVRAPSRKALCTVVRCPPALAAIASLDRSQEAVHSALVGDRELGSQTVFQASLPVHSDAVSAPSIAKPLSSALR
jgi:hypothetical protein